MHSSIKVQEAKVLYFSFRWHCDASLDALLLAVFPDSPMTLL